MFSLMHSDARCALRERRHGPRGGFVLQFGERHRRPKLPDHPRRAGQRSIRHHVLAATAVQREATEHCGSAAVNGNDLSS